MSKNLWTHFKTTTVCQGWPEVGRGWVTSLEAGAVTTDEDLSIPLQSLEDGQKGENTGKKVS